MKGEDPSAGYGYEFSLTEPATREEPTPEMPTKTSELPLAEEIEPAESIKQSETTPVPTLEQRRFSAPMADWDPIR